MPETDGDTAEAAGGRRPRSGRGVPMYLVEDRVTFPFAAIAPRSATTGPVDADASAGGAGSGVPAPAARNCHNAVPAAISPATAPATPHP